MSDFSQMLSTFIAQKNIGTYSLAQYCGIDRSTIYKIINGKRTPSSAEIVNKMALFMHLTPGEKSELLHAYEIAVIGYDTYYQRKTIYELLKKFNHQNFSFSSPESSLISPEINIDEQTVSLVGSPRISQVLFSILTNEAAKKEGHIDLLIQPDYSYVMELIHSLGLQNHNLSIRHIFAMNNTEKVPPSKKNYNLECLSYILPIYLCGCKYHTYYYYDNITFNQNKFHAFPYLVLTGSFAIILSEDFEYAILFHESASCQTLHNMFEKFISEADPLINQIDTLQTQVAYCDTLLNKTATPQDTVFIYQQIPCMTPFFKEKLLRKYLSVDLPDKDMMLKYISAYTQKLMNHHLQVPTVSIFSEEGILHFLKTGIFDEFPKDIYTPVELQDRIYLIRQVLQHSKDINFRMLKQPIGSVENGLNICLHNYGGYFLFHTAENKLVYLDIQESSLLVSFNDYFRSLNDDLFYTTEEMTERLNRLL